MASHKRRHRGGRSVLLSHDTLAALDRLAAGLGLVSSHGKRAGLPDTVAAVRALVAVADRPDVVALARAAGLPEDGPPRVYVACASSDLELAEEAVRAVRDLGCEVTHDWTREVRALGSAPADAEVAMRAALADLKGVAAAECLLVVDGGESYGRTVELGAGLMRAMHGPFPIVQWRACGDLSRGRIWERLVDLRHEDLLAAARAARDAAVEYRGRSGRS